MDAGRPTGRQHPLSHGNTGAPPDLSVTLLRRGLGGCELRDANPLRAVHARRRAPLLRLPGRPKRPVLRSRRRQALRRSVLRLPSLPRPGICQAERDAFRPASPKGEQEAEGTGWGARNGIMSAATTKGHVAADIRTGDRGDLGRRGDGRRAFRGPDVQTVRSIVVGGSTFLVPASEPSRIPRSRAEGGDVRKCVQQHRPVHAGTTKDWRRNWTTPSRSWLLFLKYLNDLEAERQDTTELEGRDYLPLLNRRYRWDVWAAPKADGKLDHNAAMTGGDLVDFVNRDLFPYLKGFRTNATVDRVVPLVRLR